MANTSWDTVTQVQMADSTAADNIVQNYQSFFRLYMMYLTGSLGGSDSLAVLALAQLCPERNGTVVFQARALYSEIYNDLTIFNDDSCLDVDTNYIAERHSTSPSIQKATIVQSYSIYPNPNDGSFIIQQYLPESTPVKIEINDVFGRTILEDNIQFVQAKSKISISTIIPGVYILKIIDDSGKEFTFKFVVQ